MDIAHNSSYLDKGERYLKEIRDWAQDGLTKKQIANKLRISRKTYYNWFNKYPEFRQAYEEGLHDRLDDIEGSLYSAAKGMTVKDTVLGENGEVVKEFVKQLPPNQKSIEYVLNNRRPDKWRADTRSIDISLSEKMKDTLSNLSANDLIKLAGFDEDEDDLDNE